MERAREHEASAGRLRRRGPRRWGRGRVALPRSVSNAVQCRQGHRAPLLEQHVQNTRHTKKENHFSSRSCGLASHFKPEGEHQALAWEKGRMHLGEKSERAQDPLQPPVGGVRANSSYLTPWPGYSLFCCPKHSSSLLAYILTKLWSYCFHDVSWVLNSFSVLVREDTKIHFSDPCKGLLMTMPTLFRCLFP